MLYILASVASASTPAIADLLPPPVVPAATAPSAWPPAAAGDKAVSGPDWNYVSGQDYVQFGRSVVTVGDIDGDGFSDVAVGAPRMRNPSSSRVGAVLIFRGSAQGLPGDPDQIIYGLHDPANYADFGYAVSPAGDVNGDGYADLLVGSPGYGSDGTIFLYLGSPSGLGASAAWSATINDFTGGSCRFGENVSTAGDVNGDGYDDIIAGTGQAWVGARGRVLAWYGGPSGPGASPAWDLTGNDLGDNLGAAVAAAGDVNADGYADVIVGLPGLRNPGNGNLSCGGVWVFHGHGDGLHNAPDKVIYGDVLDSRFGAAVSGAGDLNGDNYADVAVGAPGYTDWAAGIGRATAYGGSVNGIESPAIWTEYGSVGGDAFGTVLAPAGDVNGDGLGDLLVGSPNYNNPGGAGEGIVALVNGSRSGAILINWWHIDTQSVLYGSAVGTAGDINGDGFSDILVGAWAYTGTLVQEGRAELYLGKADAPGTTSLWYRSGQSGSFLGWAMAPAGDVNGDGFGDMLVTAPNYTWNAPNDGLVLLYLGGASGLQGLSWYAAGPYSGSSFGYAVCGADLNGDGYDDVVVGAPDYSHEGFVKVWYGGPSGLQFGAPADITYTGPAVGSHYGASVAAGDIDGDGIADLVVGAPTASNGIAGEGRAFGYGSRGELPWTWSIAGGQLDGHLGNSVAFAGDVNGDGFGDLVVGMEDWDRPLGGQFSLLDVGRALVFHGAPGGPGPGANTVLQGNGNDNFGHVVAGAGDVNGDGFADLLISSVYSDPSNQGSAAVFPGSPTGVSTSAFWSVTSGQAYSAFGSSVASAGDVNGDGLSDLVIGSVFGDTGGLVDNGRVWVYAGQPDGQAPVLLREWDGSHSYENVGNSVAGLGDLNGDGFADVGSGSPGFTGSVNSEGRFQVWYGNGQVHGPASAWTVRARRVDGATPVSLGGIIGASRDFRLAAYGLSAAGRVPTRLEWETVAAGQDFAVQYPGAPDRGAWVTSGAWYGPDLQTPAIAAPTGGTACWRARVAARSPYFPHSPWFSPVRNGWSQIDLRWADWTIGVDDPGVPGVAGLGLAAAPNPFNPRTHLRFALHRDGAVRVEVFDLAGRLVRVLLDEVRPAGAVDLVWDGQDDAGRAAASGLYFARVTAGGETASLKMTLVR